MRNRFANHVCAEIIVNKLAERRKARTEEIPEESELRRRSEENPKSMGAQRNEAHCNSWHLARGAKKWHV